MKHVIAGLALGVAVAMGAGQAFAATCPLLVKQLNDQLANVKDEKKAADAKKLTAECDQLHKDGKHAESVAKCQEAATVAGIKLQMKQ
jgi:hypothetical protein